MLVKACPNLGIQPVLVFTKCDKYSRMQRKRRRDEIAAELGEDPESLLLYSSKDGIGRDELWKRIADLCGVDPK
jgi:GTP-binding protein EngB required for normal cell division